MKNSNWKAFCGMLIEYALCFFLPNRRKNAALCLTEGANVPIPAGILRSASDRFGALGLVLTDGILFGGWLIALLIVDLAPCPWQILQRVVGAVCCCAGFDVLLDVPRRAICKAAWIFACAAFGGSWMLCAAFLIAFEHIGGGRSYE